MTPPKTIPFGRPWITDEDRRAVMEVLDGPILTHGPQCSGFEGEFAQFVSGKAHCVTTSSCMGALHLAYIGLGIGPGDEVLVPAQTHVATVHAVEWVGARPVFVDCDRETGNITPQRISSAITGKTKAISVVHFVGIPCDMPGIMDIAAGHGLKVIEDCAIALGTRLGGTHVGLFGDAGCFSFYPVKHITTGEGGMFVTRHRELAESVNRIRGFGVDRTHMERSIPGQYDVPMLGLNYRMSEMQAALGRSQLRRFEENLRIRRSNFESLKRHISDIEEISILDAVSPEAQNSYYCMTVILLGQLAERRNEVVSQLNKNGVGTSIYYPQPVPRMTYYRTKYGYNDQAYPNAAAISDQSIALPVGTHLNDDDMHYIAAVFKKTIKEADS